MKIDYKLVLGEILIFIVGLAIFIFCNPVSEFMTCDSTSLCKIEHNFIGGITHSHTIKITPYSRLDIEEKEVVPFSKHARTEYHYNVIIDKYRHIFIKPYYRSSHKVQRKYETRNFDLYKKDPARGYRIKSSAFPQLSWLCVIIWTIIMSCLIIGTIFENSGKQKWTPAKTNRKQKWK